MTDTAPHPTTATATAPDDPAGLAARYREDGFVVLPDLLSPADLAGLDAEVEAICRGERGTVDGLADTAQAGSTLDLLRSILCVHFPHKVSPAMLDVARRSEVVAPLTQVIGPDVKLVQSMFFVKSEGKPGQAWHQDENFIPTRDRSLAAVWIAVDDATVENGCLWALPGSHRTGVLYPDRETDDARFDCTVESYDFPYRDEDAVPLELPAGSAVLFDGHLLHRSLPNTGRHGMRRALVFHYMSAQSRLPWFRPADGDWMAHADHRDIVMVAGEDPYAYLGTTDVWRPHVRPEREGGCAR
jgi:ectoine hydroxylase-related dioxygenase (phytanoyl-CoA dioxygenase family)